MLVLLIISAGLLANGLRKRRQGKKQLELGLSLFCYVQTVIGLLQQHRGLSNAGYVSGERFDQELAELQGQLGVLFKETSNKTLEKFENWQSFLDHWPKLKDSTNLRKLTATQSMRQHSALIESQFFLMDEIAEHFGLHRIKLDDMSYMYSLCIDTLRTAEIIAKARGFGSGLCDGHENLAADVLALRFINSELSVSSGQLSGELVSVRNQELLSYFKQSSQTIGKSVEQLVSVIENTILDPKKCMKTQDYFKLATIPIKQLSDVNNTIIDYVTSKHGFKR